MYPYTIKRISIYKSTILSDIALINQILFNYMIVEILNDTQNFKYDLFLVQSSKEKIKYVNFPRIMNYQPGASGTPSTMDTLLSTLGYI